jgi:hypothetical protein
VLLMALKAWPRVGQLAKSGQVRIID